LRIGLTMPARQLFRLPVALRSHSIDNYASCKCGGSGHADPEKYQSSDQASSPQLKLTSAVGYPVIKDNLRWGFMYSIHEPHFPFLLWFVWLLMFYGEVSSRKQTVNPEIDHDRVDKYSREELCFTRHLEPCRFRNPMNNDCGARAIEYSWCMKGDEL
jgi:hypothetical protein